MKYQRPTIKNLVGVTFLLVAFLIAAQASAQSSPVTDPAEGLLIQSIVFDVPVGTDVNAAAQTIQTHAGDPYHTATIRKDIAALSALGRYSRVATRTELAQRGIILVFELHPLAKVRSVRFEGDIKFSQTTLAKQTRVKPGEIADPYKLKLDLETLRSYYRDNGYLFASVEQRFEDDETGVETNIVYAIIAGTILRIESVRFEGNQTIPAKELKKLMISARPAAPYSNKRSRYDPVLLRSDLGAIREAFRTQGYLDAIVGHELTFDESKERAYIVIRIRQGERYDVESLDFEGATLFDAETLRAKMVTHADGVYAPEVLDQDIMAIKRLYGRQGYVKAIISPETTFLEDKPSVRLILRIDEGPLCTVNRVLIRGNWRTKDHVIRRDISLLPGTQANVDDIEKSERLLTNTGLFQSPLQEREISPVNIRFLDTDQDDEVDVVVDVVEGPRGFASFGASYGSGFGFAGDMKLSLSNFDALDYPKSWRSIRHGDFFMGGGQDLTLSLSPGSVYSDYRLTWLNPRVWDSPYHVGFDAYLQDHFWSDFYDTRRKGIALRVGRTFLDDFTVSLVPRLENVNITNVDAAAPLDAFLARGSHDRRALALVLSYDRRDNIFLPSTGYKLSANLENVGTFLGGNVDVFHEFFEAQKWWTVWDHPGWGKQIFTMGVRVSAVDAPGNDDVPIFERSFLGGLGSVRGFRSQRAGPIDPITGKHIGGKYLGLMTAEYTLPLYENFIRGVAFFDAGALEQSMSDFNSRSIRMSAGGGFRLRIPQLGMQRVPIAFYLSFPIQKQSTDRLETFSFNIGTGFAF